jgi:hypothetical protein
MLVDFWGFHFLVTPKSSTKKLFQEGRMTPVDPQLNKLEEGPGWDSWCLCFDL